MTRPPPLNPPLELPVNRCHLPPGALTRLSIMVPRSTLKIAGSAVHPHPHPPAEISPNGPLSDPLQPFACVDGDGGPCPLNRPSDAILVLKIVSTIVVRLRCRGIGWRLRRGSWRPGRSRLLGQECGQQTDPSDISPWKRKHPLTVIRSPISESAVSRPGRRARMTYDLVRKAKV